MCGIFGILANTLPQGAIIKEALDSIRHRGPDDEGYVFFDGVDHGYIAASGNDSSPELKERYKNVLDLDGGGCPLVLGNRRLAIIDLSPRGHQPMSYAEGDLWITYNGEIFNYRELRRELSALGCSFFSDTDTEVVLAAYSQWGEECVSRFNGQWAFCIYDRRKKRLFCSRDRFGIKPFYYWFDGEHFAFASEIKALLKLPFVKKELNRPLIADFMLFHMHHHTRESLYMGINQLLPSQNLIVDVREMNIQTNTYYRLYYSDEMGKYSNTQAMKYAGDIRDILIDAVKIRLTSNVPVGSCLSGGLDSSSIVVIINKLLKEGGTAAETVGKRQKTFTVCFDDPLVDEKKYADEVIKHTNVNGFLVYPTAERLWKELDDFLFYQDGLCFMTNVYGGWEAMRLASHHVKVVLNGQGGDELFGGYSPYEDLYLAGMIREKRFIECLAYLSKKSRLYGFTHSFKKSLMSLYLALVPNELNELKVYLFKKKNKRKLDSIRDLLGDYYLDNGSLDRMIDRLRSFNHQLYCDLTRDYLPQLLHYDDRNASAFSIENRVPFVDHRLIEYVSHIPAIYKCYGGWRKWLLRLAMRDLLPEKIRWRKDKIGFSTPENAWMGHQSSPIPSLVSRYGVKEYGKHFPWKFYLVQRLLARYKHNVSA